MKKLFLIFMCVSLGGCKTAMPHSEPYAPSGGIEKEFFAKADFSIFPNDVRANPDKFKDKVVAWAGVISDAQLDEPAEHPEYSWWRIKVKHHYFDWIQEKNDPYSIEFHMSNQGEGDFSVVIGHVRYSGPEKEKQIALARKAFAPGNMIWAYGNPDKVDNGVVRLNRGFANSIDKAYYNAETMKYGRAIPSEATKSNPTDRSNFLRSHKAGPSHLTNFIKVH